jgi:hypothetical protein
MFHRHHPICTGRRITASFGKDNLPDNVRPVVSTGDEALCTKCGTRLIVHDPRYNFPVLFTELEAA